MAKQLYEIQIYEVYNYTQFHKGNVIIIFLMHSIPLSIFLFYFILDYLVRSFINITMCIIVSNKASL